MSVYQTIIRNVSAGKKMLAALLDPDVFAGNRLSAMIEHLQHTPPDFVFVGGSTSSASMETLICALKNALTIPVALFPGNISQFVPSADALLNISLVSGRNAEYLIGQHIAVSMAIKRARIEVIPTAYMLIEGGRISTTEYVSNTRSIPSDRPGIAVATALAGEQLGMRVVYLEAGSGAKTPVSAEMIKAVRTQIGVPLIVGGGICTPQQLQNAFGAGADLVVVGNVLEKEPQMLEALKKMTV
ncbi:MAG: geranylgeranylglyceryl/heptaprenylglyceryl phosphate synthase [Prevotellaceae bacterium]|jgi:putative glycerol-1-phosphate prenyltransferase|nr:geranylgeranylglyceryl/heptaprenylglyceryl phosphate synthase [Prevotellaceae bacterium]